MKSFKFLVQGSSIEPYETEFYFDGSNLTGFCNCAAGSNGQVCKHRTDILKGDASKIVSTNNEEINSLLSVFENSPLGVMMKRLKEEETQLEQLKKQVDKTKKEVAKLFRG